MGFSLIKNYFYKTIYRSEYIINYMPNWCYNETSFEVDNTLFTKITNLLSNIKINNILLPTDLVQKITSILFNYNLEISDDDYLNDFVEDLSCDIDIGVGNDYFNFESKWGPPNDIFLEYSSKYPFILIRNEYYSTEDDYEGTDVIINEKFLLNESFITSELAWERNGENCILYLLNELINEDYKIIDKDNIVKFKNIEDIQNFCKKNKNNIDIIFDHLDIYQFMNDYELDNCEDKIREVFQNKILNIKS